MKQSVDFASENFAKSTDLYGFRRVRFRLLVAIHTCKWVRFCAEHKKRDRHPFVVLSVVGDYYGYFARRIFARSTPDKRACRSPSGKCEPMRRTSLGLMSVRVNQRQKKRKRTRTGICSALQGFRHGSGGAMFRTHILKIADFQSGSIPTESQKKRQAPTRSVCLFSW